jgi:hypothetical protein
MSNCYNDHHQRPSLEAIECLVPPSPEHELGHLLLGQPDLYDTDYSSRGTGRWDLMAGGSWNNNDTAGKFL